MTLCSTNFMGAPAPGTPMLPMPVTFIIHHSSLNRIASLVNNNYMILVILYSMGHTHQGESLVLL